MFKKRSVRTLLTGKPDFLSQTPSLLLTSVIKAEKAKYFPSSQWPCEPQVMRRAEIRQGFLKKLVLS